VLARTGSFTLAAKELFLSQSAVSHSMKALENDVGCRLFDRLGKRVLLTQAGEQFLRYADQIISQMSRARSSLEELGKWGRGRIRVGASHTFCEHILPGVLREFRESFGKCFVTMESGDSPAVLKMLRDNRIDLAICLEPSNEEQFEFHPVFTDELWFLTSPEHPWVAQGRVNREEVACQEYILYNKDSFTFRAIEQYFEKEGIVLNMAMCLGSMTAIKELVKLRMGVTVAPLWTAREELQANQLSCLPLGKRKLKRNWGLCHWRGRRLSLPEETFVGLCRTAGRQVFTMPMPEAA
jgi:DNA-binding transcriptional LysR family regulator